MPSPVGIPTVATTYRIIKRKFKNNTLLYVVQESTDNVTWKDREDKKTLEDAKKLVKYLDGFNITQEVCVA